MIRLLSKKVLVIVLYMYRSYDILDTVNTQEKGTCFSSVRLLLVGSYIKYEMRIAGSTFLDLVLIFRVTI